MVHEIISTDGPHNFQHLPTPPLNKFQDLTIFLHLTIFLVVHRYTVIITYYRHLVLLNTPGWGVSSPCSLLRLADFVAVEAWQATSGLHIVEHGAKRLPHAQTNWPSDVLGFCCWAPWWNGARRTAYPKIGRLFRTPTPIIPTQGGTVSLNIVQTTNQGLVTRSFTAIFS